MTVDPPGRSMTFARSSSPTDGRRPTWRYEASSRCGGPSADRSRSQVPPGARDGPFRVLYVFGDEALSELRNATVHAFLALALRRRPEGYTLYLAVYVKPVTRLTPLYMTLIDPFRRFIVYPAIGRRIQDAWSRAYA